MAVIAPFSGPGGESVLICQGGLHALPPCAILWLGTSSWSILASSSALLPYYGCPLTQGASQMGYPRPGSHMWSRRTFLDRSECYS